MPSISADIVTTVVYGTAGTIIGVVTVYQSYVAWQLWHEHHHNSGQSSQGVPATLSPLALKDKLYLLLCTDVELALGSALVIRQASSNTASTNVAPVHDAINVQPVVNVQPVANDQPVANLQSFTNGVTSPTSSQQLGLSDSSTADLEPTEGGNESQATASPGIDPDAAFTLPLQPLQTPELDVVTVQDTISTQAVAKPNDPSVSSPTLNPPDVPASTDMPVHTTGRS